VVGNKMMIMFSPVGQAAALDWLKGLKQNRLVFDDDEGVIALGSGQVNSDQAAIPDGQNQRPAGHARIALLIDQQIR
jgi:hypothetical protein